MFQDVFLDGYLPAKPSDATSFKVLLHPSRIFSLALERAMSSEFFRQFARDDVAHIQQISNAIRSIPEFVGKIPDDTIPRPEEFRDLLSTVVSRVQSMRPGELLTVPVGWYKGANVQFFSPSAAVGTLPETLNQFKEVEAKAKTSGDLT